MVLLYKAVVAVVRLIKNNFFSKIEINNIYKIFGPDPLSIMPLLQEGIGKDEVLERTHQHVLGLKDINVEMQAGEITVVMGLSGSGKSTLINILAGLVKKSSGNYSFKYNIINLDKKNLINFRRDKMSMVFQKFGLFNGKNYKGFKN